MLPLPKNRPAFVDDVGGGGFWICDAVGARDWRIPVAERSCQHGVKNKKAAFVLVVASPFVRAVEPISRTKAATGVTGRRQMTMQEDSL